MASRKRPHETKADSVNSTLNSSLEEIDLQNGQKGEDMLVSDSASVKKCPAPYVSNRPVSFDMK
jgi:hypothetical protein